MQDLQQLSLYASHDHDGRKDRTDAPILHPGATLCLGVCDIEMCLPEPHDERYHLLLQWPGFAYLPYGFTKDELIATAERIVADAGQPLPPGFLTTSLDVLRLNSEVRHWLENRQRNVLGITETVERAATGDITLHTSHFDPVPAISEEHQSMLQRFWDLDEPVARLAPGIGGLTALRAVVTCLESQWQLLEAIKASLRAENTPDPKTTLISLRDQYRLICNTLSLAIQRTVELDSAMAEKKED